MNDKEYEEFKRLKEILLNHLSKVIPKPLILVIDNVNVKGRLEEVFKYDIQELSKYGENELFLMNNPKLKVFKICTACEYENWCNETMSSDTKNFILAETNSRIKKAEADLKEMQTLHNTYNESVATIDLKKIEKCPGSTSIVILNETNKSEKDSLKSVDYNLDKETNKLSRVDVYGKFTTNHQTTLDVCKNPNQTLSIKLKDARKDSIE